MSDEAAGTFERFESFFSIGQATHTILIWVKNACMLKPSLIRIRSINANNVIQELMYK